VSCFELLFQCIAGKDGDPSKWVPTVIIYVGLSYLEFTILLLEEMLIWPDALKF